MFRRSRFVHAAISVVIFTIAARAGQENGSGYSDFLLNGRPFSVLIPNGWKSENSGRGDVVLTHSSGATFIFRALGARSSEALETSAKLGVDRVMQPLGFASFGDSLERKVNGAPAIQVAIQGNRLSEPHRLRYIVFRRGSETYEMIYESGDSQFDLLLAEAEKIGTSIDLQPANEGRAIVELRRLLAAESAFRKSHRRFGTLPDLISVKLLADDFQQSIRDYQIRLSVVGERYRVEMIPLPGSRVWGYQADESGVIRYSSINGLAPRGLAGKPVQ